MFILEKAVQPRMDTDEKGFHGTRDVQRVGEFHFRFGIRVYPCESVVELLLPFFQLPGSRFMRPLAHAPANAAPAPDVSCGHYFGLLGVRVIGHRFGAVDLQ